LSLLDSVGGNLNLKDNAALNNISGISDIDFIGGGFQINECPQISSIPVFNNLTQIGNNFRIANNPLLSSIEGFDALVSVGGNFGVYNNEQLDNLEAFNTLETIDSSLLIANNSVIDLSESLVSLSSVNQDVRIIYNPSLSSLNGFSSLSSINGKLTIQGLSSLTSLTGLDNINPTGITELLIQNNQQLSVCNIESVCAFLIPENQDNINIQNNAPNCNTAPEVNHACMSTSVENLSDNIVVHPNPCSSSINIGTSFSGRTYQVYNHMGQRVQIGNVDGLGNVFTNALQAGYYVLKLEHNSVQFIKQ
jgi:hypothetical protein